MNITEMSFGLGVTAVLLQALILVRLMRSSKGAVNDVTSTLLSVLRDDVARSAADLRSEMLSLNESMAHQMDRIRNALDGKASELISHSREGGMAIDKRLNDLCAVLAAQLKIVTDDQRTHFESVSRTLQEQLKAHRDELIKVQSVVDLKLGEIRQGNEAQLERMRVTVDEKLQGTLEQRLGASFRQVSQQLESVQRGLGEMQNLAADVGNLNRVLSNVKVRGIFGETQLKAILEQILTPDQYSTDYRPKEGRESVEFAIRLPGGSGAGDPPVFLPIDAKFPKEDYDRLVDAADKGDKAGVDSARRDLLARIEKSAKEIHDKYIEPPVTTNFAVMFLPTEGLYAEALREPGFHELIQTRYKVVITGPTTLSALLNSLRMGFQTLAIEKRSAQVWEVLGAVRTEFSKFSGVLEKIKRNLGTASKSLDEATGRTRAMERKLKDVESASDEDAARLLDTNAVLAPGTGSPSDDEESALAELEEVSSA